MEIVLDDLVIGYQPIINFKNMRDDYNRHTSTFKLMSSSDNKTYVIVYQWVDNLCMMYNDMEEAFYIDGINSDNYNKARSIVLDIYMELAEAFNNNPNQLFNMESLVNDTINHYKNNSRILIN